MHVRAPPAQYNLPKQGPTALTNQGSKNEWCELGEHNGVGWTISFKDLQETPRNVPQLVMSPKLSEGKHPVPDAGVCRSVRTAPTV